MKWLPVIFAAISLAREIVKYLTEKEKSKRERKKKIMRLKDGFKTARLANNTTDIEHAFSDIGINLGVSQDGMSDDGESESGSMEAESMDNENGENDSGE